jgi:hypothetical protein
LILTAGEEEKKCPAAFIVLTNRCFESASVDSNSKVVSKNTKSGVNGNHGKGSCKYFNFSEICEALETIMQEEQQRLRDREKAIPDGFICPITQDVMRDPVMLIDGHSYERKAIVDWLTQQSQSIDE